VFDVSPGRPGEVGVHPDRDLPGMVPPRPPASAGTGGLGDLVVSLSCEVPDSLGQLNSLEVQASLTRQALSHVRTLSWVTNREHCGSGQRSQGYFLTRSRSAHQRPR
jgi:hypothetical protein